MHIVKVLCTERRWWTRMVRTRLCRWENSVRKKEWGTFSSGRMPRIWRGQYVFIRITANKISLFTWCFRDKALHFSLDQVQLYRHLCKYFSSNVWYTTIFSPYSSPLYIPRHKFIGLGQETNMKMSRCPKNSHCLLKLRLHFTVKSVSFLPWDKFSPRLLLVPQTSGRSSPESASIAQICLSPSQEGTEFRLNWDRHYLSFQ